MVDTREPKTLDQGLSQVGFEVFRQTLDSGDFLWVAKDGKTVAVERKTTNDLLAAMKDTQANGHPRLKNQLERMLQAYDINVLLIEGKLTCGPDGFAVSEGRSTGWQWDGLDNMLISIQRSGVILATCHRGRVPERLVTLVNYFNKKKHTLGPLPSEVRQSKVGVAEFSERKVLQTA